MTKKSYARMVRDAKKAEAKRQLENNKCWDDLIGLKNDCTAQLMMHVTVGGLANNKPLVQAVEDKDTLLTNLRLYQSDLMQLNNELKEISALHADKSGGTQDPDELMFSIEIYEKYILWQQRHDAVLLPTALHVAEQFDQAELRLAAAVAKIEAAQGAAEGAASIETVTQPVGALLEQTLAGDPVVAGEKDRMVTHIKLDENDPNPQATVQAVMEDLQAAKEQ